jgi:hypothetical protein
VVKITPHSQEWLCHEYWAERGECKKNSTAIQIQRQLAGETLALQRQRLAV